MREIIFRFGKYRGQLIYESNDIDYLKWYYSALTIEMDKPHILKRVKELDDTVQEYDGELRSLEDIELLKNTKEDVYDIPVKRYIDVVFDKNVDHSGIVPIMNLTHLHFNNVKMMGYGGYTYYLPVFNGKGTQIKNKAFRVHIDIINSNPPEYYRVEKLEKI